MRALTRAGAATVMLLLLASGPAAAKTVLLPSQCFPHITIGRLTASALASPFGNGHPFCQSSKHGSKTSWKTDDAVLVNGIEVLPRSGKKVEITKEGSDATVSASKAKVIINPLGADARTIFDGKVSWTAGSDHKLQGFKLDTGLKLHGLAIAGLAGAPKLQADGTAPVKAWVALPDDFGGSAGAGPTSSQGVTLAPIPSSYAFDVGSAALGPLTLSALKVTYSSSGDQWSLSGTGKLPLPIAPEIPFTAGIAGGKLSFAKLEGGWGGGTDIANLVSITQLSGEVVPHPKLNPPDAGIGPQDCVLAWGKAAPPSDYDFGIPNFAACGSLTVAAGPILFGTPALALDGSLYYNAFPDRPWRLQAFGDAKLAGFSLGSAFLELRGDGYVDVDGSLHIGVDGLATFDADAEYEQKGAEFNLDGGGQGCLFGVACAGGRAIVSSKGWAVCINPFLDWWPGVGQVWGQGASFDLGGCDIGAYKATISAARHRARAAGTQQDIAIAAGLLGEVVTVHGQGAAPHVAMVSPSGRRFVSPTDDTVTYVPGEAMVIRDDGHANVHFLLHHPEGGTWKLAVAKDSAPVASVETADSLPRIQVAAKVLGTGRHRALVYRLVQQPNETVEFLERGNAPTLPNVQLQPMSAAQFAQSAPPLPKPTGDAAVSAFLGTATAATGRIPFTPADGVGGTRTIYARIYENGLPRREIPLTTYTAPAPVKPAKPAHLHLSRQGSTLQFSWGATTDASSYSALVELGDGRRILIPAGTSRTLKLSQVDQSLDASAIVGGFSASGLPGPTAQLKLRGLRANKHRHR